MKEPQWLDYDVLLEQHRSQIEQFGGVEGVRDQDRLDVAMTRAKLAWTYGISDPHLLAAKYADALVNGHPFYDGNKRIGLLAAALFLEANGFEFLPQKADAIENTLKLAKGELTEEGFAEWLKDCCKPKKKRLR